MKNPAVIILGFLVVLVAGVVLTADSTGLYVSGKWRYKMTVTVETTEGVKAGSAVREISNSASKIKIVDLPSAINPAKVNGEAVVVDLGKRGTLFALMKGYKRSEGYPDGILYDVFGGGTNVGRIQSLSTTYKNNIGKRVTLDLSDYPVLIMFKSSKDPKSVTPALEVVPETDFDRLGAFKMKADHFEELFGPGVKLKSITIELTDEPVTNLVKKYLPSFEEETEFWKWIKTLDYGDPRLINPTDFYKGAI